MSRFRSALASIRTTSLPPLRLSHVPGAVAAAERLSDAPEEMSRPRKGKNYDEVARELLARDGRATLTWREARDGAWCLWATQPALSTNPAALDLVLHGVRRSKKRQPFRALASSYVASYQPDMAGVEPVSRLLSELAPRYGRPWADLHRSFQIFHETAGPQSVARAAISGRTSPTEILKDGGLGALDAHSGFAKACAAEALKQLAAGAQRDHLKRLELVRSLSLRADGQLVFEDHAPLVAYALLKPFDSSTPEKSLRDTFLRVVLQLFGHPRLSPGRWSRLRDLEHIVLRWLTEQSLRQFLGVVDRIAEERMWKYRRAFWEAIYDAGLISEAWVVFDHYGVSEVRKAFGREASFGRFKTGGLKQIQRGHAVLLMRLGRGVVADWSHNGKCNIWNDADASDAPKLYRREYTSDDVRTLTNASSDLDQPVFSVAHMGADSYSWQGRVADKIHQMTGVRVPRSAYQVR